MNKKRYDKVIKECRDLVISRNKQYGNTVDVVDIHTLVGLCIMKLSRIYKLGEENAKTKDELQDSLNYIVFALEKLNEGENFMEKLRDSLAKEVLALEKLENGIRQSRTATSTSLK